MTLQERLKESHLSIYQLSKASAVPYATCNDLVNGKARMEKCNAETVYKIAQALKVPMETLLAPCFVKRSSFENFKSAICHRVKELGDIPFIMETLESGEIRTFFERKWYPECLYLLAMLDYLSRENHVPLCNEYDDLRLCKLEKTLYPASVLAMTAVSGKKDELTQIQATAIPEFQRFNIIENEVRNVI